MAKMRRCTSSEKCFNREQENGLKVPAECENHFSRNNTEERRTRENLVFPPSGLQAASRGRRNNASASSNVTAEDDAIGRDSRERAEGEDEYEDELKAVAESHEAMSRDDTRNSNASTAASAGLADEASSVAKNFDSREVITVNSSDEDVASNEAITDEIVDKYDQEVRVFLLCPFCFFFLLSPFFSRSSSLLVWWETVRLPRCQTALPQM